MVKGFTKDGKFHPIKPYNKVRKSRDQKEKTQGVRMKRTKGRADKSDEHDVTLIEDYKMDEIDRRVEELTDEDYDEYLDNLGDDGAIDFSADYTASRVLKEVDPIRYNVGRSDFESSEHERFEQDVNDEIDEKASLKAGRFIEQ